MTTLSIYDLFCYTNIDTETFRYRLCDNPTKYGSAPECPGISTQSETCTTECPGKFISKAHIESVRRVLVILPKNLLHTSIMLLFKYMIYDMKIICCNKIVKPIRILSVQAD